MTHQWMCAFGICVLLAFYADSKADEDVGYTIEKPREFRTDVVQLQGNVKMLLADVEVIYKYYNKQNKLLEEIHSEFKNQTSHDSVCDGITLHLNGTFLKYNTVEESISDKLDEVHGEQSSNLNTILVKQNLSTNCKRDSALDLISEIMSEMVTKIDKFETKLQILKTLEGKLKQQEIRAQSSSDEKLKFLNDINTKLTLHQENFEILEKQWPDLLKEAESVGEVYSQKKKHLLSKEHTLGL